MLFHRVVERGDIDGSIDRRTIDEHELAETLQLRDRVLRAAGGPERIGRVRHAERQVRGLVVAFADRDPVLRLPLIHLRLDETDHRRVAKAIDHAAVRAERPRAVALTERE